MRHSATGFAPASVANVAVGFDVLGFAIEGVGDRVTVSRAGGPGQVVIAGATAAVEAAAEACREAGARRAVLLPVSGPFHCELMRPAQDAFADVLGGIDLVMPGIPIVHNVDGEIAPDIVSWQGVVDDPDPAAFLREPTLPHPRLHLRAFALRPFYDVWPTWVHPVYGEVAATMLSRLPTDDMPELLEVQETPGNA